MRRLIAALMVVLLPAIASAQPVVELLVSPESREVIRKHFPLPGQNEFGWCVQRLGVTPAQPTGVSIRLYDVVPGRITFASRTTVHFDCPAGAALLLHSHPYGHCQPSMDDYKWAVGVWMVWSIHLTGIVCGPDHIRLVQIHEALAMILAYTPVPSLVRPDSTP